MRHHVHKVHHHLHRHRHKIRWSFIISVIGVIGLAYIYTTYSPPIIPKKEEHNNKINEVIKQGLEKMPNVTITPAPPSVLLPGAKWVGQTFNNCGPATVSMVLQYFGHDISQEETKAALRTNPDDKNVFTYEIRDYLKAKYNIESKLLYNGTMDRLKLLIANGIYIVIEDWLHPNEDIGHVTILRGYDDTEGVFIADDSFTGVGIKYKYTDFDEGQWKPFNREYLPVYTLDKEAIVQTIVGTDWDETTMYLRSVQVNSEDTEKDPKDMYAWFNLGTSYFALQNFVEAKQAFETARTLGWPRRMLWYQIQPVQTYNTLGEYEEALKLADEGLLHNDSFTELHFEKAVSYKGLGDIEKARKEAEKALYYDENYKPANRLLDSL